MSDRKIVFLGDSFTWGEGLELYSDSPKWVNERTTDNNNWLILKSKQDEESIKFRTENRFPHLVSKTLNCEYLIDSENGGTISRYLHNLQDFLIANNEITDVVLQFTTFSREPLHLSFDCRCDFCLDSFWAPMMDNLNMYVFNHIDNTTENINESQRKVYDYISTKIGISDINDVQFLNKADNYVKSNFSNQLKWLYDGFFIRLEKTHDIRIHFIDSWCNDTSKLLMKLPEYYSKMIPLIGTTGRRYSKWGDWVETFEYKSIGEEYPLTGNGHPTLDMHKYLAKSIVNYFGTIL